MNTPLQTEPSTTKKTEDKDSFEFSADEYQFSYTDGFGKTISGTNLVHIADSFYGNGAIELGILPPVVRYISPDYMGCIIERPPQIHTLEFKNAAAYTNKTADNTKRFSMALPWTVYVVRLTPSGSLSYLNIFFRNNQIWTTLDTLYSACLPNTYHIHGGTCMDAKSPINLKKQSKTLAEGINNAISGFWSGLFNTDLKYFLNSDGSLPGYIAAKAGKNLEDAVYLTAEEFFKAYEDITIDEALEIEYKNSSTNVEEQIKLLDSESSSKAREKATTVRSYFTPIINAAKKKA